MDTPRLASESLHFARVSLLVDDYDKAVAFYSEQTQLFTLVADTKLGQGLQYVVLVYKNPTAPLCLVVFKVQNPDDAAIIGKQAGGLPFLTLPVNYCRIVYNLIKSAGVEFEGEPIRLPYGCQANMKDPFGNRICLVQAYQSPNSSRG